MHTMYTMYTMYIVVRQITNTIEYGIIGEKYRTLFNIGKGPNFFIVQI